MNINTVYLTNILTHQHCSPYIANTYCNSLLEGVAIM